MSIREVLAKLAFRADGSFKTVHDRQNVASRLGDYLRMNNIQIKEVQHLKTAHIVGYISSRKDSGIGLRTLQNEMSSIRVMLKEANREQFAKSENLSNKMLGISGASRDGTHLAMPESMFSNICNQLKEVDLDVHSCALLQRHLGLRAEEAIQGCKSLKTWTKQLEKGDVVRVIFGTKGGRARDTRVINIQTAKEVIALALTRMKNNGGKIINKADLKSAMNRYHYVMRKCGCVGEYASHSLRYTYADERVDAYLLQNFTLQESEGMTSLDLGHGDGRGRYIRQVYRKNKAICQKAT